MVATTSSPEQSHRVAVDRAQIDRPRPEWTRACLVQAARDLFAQRGFGATTLRGIAESVGLTRPVIHYHFDSKLGLFDAVLDHIDASVLAPRVAAAHACASSSEQLRELLRPVPHYDAEMRAAMAFLVAAWIDSQRWPELHSHVCTRLTRLREFVHSLLSADPDRASRDVDGAAVEMMLSILWGWALTSAGT